MSTPNTPSVTGTAPVVDETPKDDTMPFETIEERFIDAMGEMAARAHTNSSMHGFWRWYEAHKHDPDSVVIWKLSRHALINSETGECTEGVRKELPDNHLSNRSMEVAELADIVIRVMDYAGGHGLPLAEVILEKMAYNAKRPMMHGDKKA
jgi:NTP pyrophosphatase (non-canonical NTP hydrolase)